MPGAQAVADRTRRPNPVLSWGAPTMAEITVTSRGGKSPPQPSYGYAVSTHGWDTAFTIPVGDVNKAIVHRKSSPPHFSYKEAKVELSGDFGDWQIVQGGDGKNIRMSLPISNVRLTYASTGKTVSFKSGTVVAEIELEFLPHTSATADADADAEQDGGGGGGGKPMALKPKLTSSGPTSPVFNVVEIHDLDPKPSLIDKAVLQGAMGAWGNANLADFNHVFSVVNLNRLVDKGKWAFVNPSYSSYAYLSLGDKVDDGLFSVLCMTGGRSGDKLDQQVAYNAIPKGSIAGFLISQQRTLQDLVRPAIMQAYKGLSDSNFKMNAALDTLYLTHGTKVDLGQRQVKGRCVDPKLTDLSVKSNGSLFTLTSITETEVVSGITAHTTATHWYTLELGTSHKGQTLKFKSYQHPVIEHSISQSEGSHITQFIISLVLTLVGILLTILTDGAAAIVAGLAIGLLMGADQILPPMIEKANKDDSPALDLLQINAVDPITWPASKQFKLDYAQLNMSLQLGGDPKFIWGTS
jgi:hypothetical protein